MHNASVASFLKILYGIVLCRYEVFKKEALLEFIILFKLL
jgi:hypothetical protein